MKNIVNEVNIEELPFGWVISCWWVEQLDCLTEEKIIKDKLKQLDKVKFVKSDFLQKKLYIAHSIENKKSIELAISSLGFTIKDFDINSINFKSFNFFNTKKFYILIISGVLAVSSEIFNYFKFSLDIIILASIISILLSGVQIFKQGFKSLLNKSLNINVLMSIAVLGSIIIGKFSEAAMVIFLYSLSEFLESYSLFIAKNNVEKIISLIPSKVLIKNNKNNLVEISVQDVKIGQIIVVKPGDKIALDGIITSGKSQVNQSPITGENIPIEKKENDLVYAGSINGNGLLEYKVISDFDNTQLSKIVNLVENAQQDNKAPINNFIDTFASFYIPIILILSFFTMFIIPIIKGNWLTWIYNGLVLLVISCPCALLISTPIALFSALTVCMRKGIIIKGSKFIELLRNVKFIGFDKTGTITFGKPYITDFICFKKNPDLFKILAISLAKYSNHPLSKAIIDNNFKKDLFFVEDFVSLSGIGVKGKIQNKEYFLGKMKYMDSNNLYCDKKILEKINFLRDEISSKIIFCDNKEVLALFILEDIVKFEVKDVISDIKKQNINVFLISGDNKYASDYVANKVGIDEVYFDQLPVDKLSIIKNKISLNKGKVIMVGDGINDSLALVGADIGISMGKLGSDLAIESSDIILINDNLSLITYLLKVSKKTFRILKENIFFSIFIKLLFIVLTLFSLSNMLMAIFADVGATLIVILNSMRLLNFNKI